jgi:hypothetical protein
MSRSRRKMPIAGVSTASSDKPFKKAENSRHRHAAGIALARGDEPPDRQLFGDPWKGTDRVDLR